MTGQIWREGFWIRLSVDGWGLQGLHRSFEPLFSERNGYTRFWPAWPARWRFRILRPRKEAR